MLFFFLFLVSAFGHREYLKFIPNSDRVECPPSVWCYGSYLCSAVGHKNCVNGKPDKFGDDTQGRWSTKVCMKDSDRDLKSNGDELGDPCCIWSMGQRPEREDPTYISHPGYSSSVTPAPSCLYEGPPTYAGLPYDLDSVWTQMNTLSISWRTPVFDPFSTVRVSCVCSLEIKLTGSEWSRYITGVAPSQSPFVICDLPMGGDIFLSIAARNLAGVSADSVSLTIHSPLFNETLVASDHDGCSYPARLDLPATGSTFPVYSPTFSFLLVITFMAPIFLLFLHFVIHRLYDDNPIRSCLVYSYCMRKSQWVCFRWLPEITWLQAMSILTFFTVIAVWLGYAHSFYEQEIYTYVEADYNHIGLITALTTYPFFAILLYPVTRYSIWISLLGVSMDRFIRYHRWLSSIVVLLVILHGVFMALAYHGGPLGWTCVLQLQCEQHDGWFGFLSGCLLVIVWLCSFEFIRRASYNFFRFVHLLYLPAIIFAIIHQPPLGLWLLPSLLLLLGDGLIAFSEKLSPYSILDVQYTSEPDGSEAYLRISIEHPSFKYHAGQHVYLWLPCLGLPCCSWMSHPFSLLPPPPHMVQRAAFSLCIKDMGPGTWTRRLIRYGTASTPSTQETSSLLRKDRTISYSNTQEFAVPSNSTSAIAPGTLADDPQSRSADFCEGPSLDSIKGLKARILGPFGTTPLQMERYRFVLLIAGGIGIVPLASHWLCFLENYHRGDRYLQQVALVWSCRSLRLIRMLSDVLWPTMPMEEGKDHFPDPFDLRLYLTPTTNEKDPRLTDFPFPIRSGRPHLKSLFAEMGPTFTPTFSDQNKKEFCHIAVLISGPPQLVQAAKTAAASVSKQNPFLNFHFHVQSFLI